jgi:hypothetical protein
MKTGIIKFRYYLKGDYAESPLGAAIVARDEHIIEDDHDLANSVVELKHKYPSEHNLDTWDRRDIHRITKKEYDKATDWNIKP